MSADAAPRPLPDGPDVDDHPVAPGGLLERSTDFLKAVAGPLSLTTVVLYYFGWVRSNAIARYWGYSTDLIGLANEDFLLRSVAALYRPVAVAVVGLFAGQHLLHAARRWVAAGRDLPCGAARWAAGLIGTGVVLLVVGAVGLDEVEADIGRQLWYRTGAALIAGPLTIGAGLWVLAAREWVGHADVRRRQPGRFLALSTRAALVAVAVVGVFVLTTQFASRVGTGRAQLTEAQLPGRAAVTLYSRDRLYLSADGVSERSLPSDGGTYRWRYRGLRLLAQGNGHLILLPGDYRDDNAVTFVVPLGAGVRMDLDRTAARRRLGGQRSTDLR